MKAAIQKHGTTAVSTLAIVTAMTSTILTHFWPEGVAVAKKSHESIAPIVNNVSEEVADLADTVRTERAMRRELARRIRVLEKRLLDQEEVAATRMRARAILTPPPPPEMDVEAEGEVDALSVEPTTVSPVEGEGAAAQTPPHRLVQQVPDFDAL